jgi:MerC mercury resistance protein
MARALLPRPEKRKGDAPKSVFTLARRYTITYMSAAMRQAIHSIRGRLDQMGVILSGLCAVHCLAGLLLVAGLGLGGGVLLAPEIHRYGLALAIAVGSVTLVMGMIRHGDPVPLQVGAAGVGFMALALFVGHGTAEAVLTILGVALLAWAHLRNLRRGY